MLLLEELFTFAGYHRVPSRCRVRVYERTGGGLIIVFSELTGDLVYLGENTGTSITNRAETLATAWRRRYPGRAMTFVEHYPARGAHWQRDHGVVWQFGETFDLVRPNWSNAEQCYANVTWRHLGRAALEALIETTWPEPLALAADAPHGKEPA